MTLQRLDDQYLGSGSIVAGADHTGAAAATKTYDEYGDTASLAWGVGYGGTLTLGLSRLGYNRARIYDPSLGRFLQADPIGYGDGMNMYAYVRGDPVNGRDPSGTCGMNSAASRICYWGHGHDVSGFSFRDVSLDDIGGGGSGGSDGGGSQSGSGSSQGSIANPRCETSSTRNTTLTQCQGGNLSSAVTSRSNADILDRRFQQRGSLRGVLIQEVTVRAVDDQGRPRERHFWEIWTVTNGRWDEPARNRDTFQPAPGRRLDYFHVQGTALWYPNATLPREFERSRGPAGNLPWSDTEPKMDETPTGIVTVDWLWRRNPGN